MADIWTVKLATIAVIVVFVIVVSKSRWPTSGAHRSPLTSPAGDIACQLTTNWPLTRLTRRQPQDSQHAGAGPRHQVDWPTGHQSSDWQTHDISVSLWRSVMNLQLSSKPCSKKILPGSLPSFQRSVVWWLQWDHRNDQSSGMKQQYQRVCVKRWV